MDDKCIPQVFIHKNLVNLFCKFTELSINCSLLVLNTSSTTKLSSMTEVTSLIPLWSNCHTSKIIMVFPPFLLLSSHSVVVLSVFCAYYQIFPSFSPYYKKERIYERQCGLHEESRNFSARWSWVARVQL